MSEDYIIEAKRRISIEVNNTIEWLKFLARECDLQWEWVLEEYRHQLSREVTKVIV